jgi:hypothetical protein
MRTRQLLAVAVTPVRRLRLANDDGTPSRSAVFIGVIAPGLAMASIIAVATVLP